MPAHPAEAARTAGWADRRARGRLARDGSVFSRDAISNRVRDNGREAFGHPGHRSFSPVRLGACLRLRLRRWLDRRHCYSCKLSLYTCAQIFNRMTIGSCALSAGAGTALCARAGTKTLPTICACSGNSEPEVFCSREKREPRLTTTPRSARAVQGKKRRRRCCWPSGRAAGPPARALSRSPEALGHLCRSFRSA